MVSNPRAAGKISILPDIAGLYGFITFALLVIFDSGKALGDGDTLWHIAAGKRMLSNHIILTQDVFSHSAFGKPWMAHEWLSEIIMAWIHQYSGLTGLVLFFFVIASLSFWLLYRIVSSKVGDWVAIITVSIAFTFSMTHMLARPHVFSWLFGVITLYALHKQGRWYWLLPPMTVLWANLHGGFILGLALQGLVIGGTVLDGISDNHTIRIRGLIQKLKRPTIFFGLSILAAGINPFGYKLYLFPFQVTSGVFSKGIVEWLPPNLQDEWLFRLFLLLILLLVSLKSTPTSWTDRLFVLFFINASLTHQRYISMASVFLCPYLASAIKSLPCPKAKSFFKPTSAQQVQTSKASGPIATIILAIALALFSGPSHPSTKGLLETFIPLPVASHPVEAVKYLNHARPTGNMFNKYAWGGYLIYALDPPQKVFIDGRADMYGEEIFEDYQKIVSVKKETEELLEKYDIDWILHPGDSTLVRYLKATGNWHETYSDEDASILVRTDKKSP